MTPLPFDYTRCRPNEPDDNCQNCRRWWDHPKQTHNPHRQSFVVTTNSKDRACIRMPVSFMEADE